MSNAITILHTDHVSSMLDQLRQLPDVNLEVMATVPLLVGSLVKLQPTYDFALDEKPFALKDPRKTNYYVSPGRSRHKKGKR